eukprot:GHVT01081251.1.p1 GENE.GHVT01081251.1~~GHVT01081251.1.p1  ORF type:complete len:594 (-),score=62.95 GHVT01081251.1:795-2576(-)
MKMWFQGVSNAAARMWGSPAKKDKTEEDDVDTDHDQTAVTEQPSEPVDEQAAEAPELPSPRVSTDMASISGARDSTELAASDDGLGDQNGSSKSLSSLSYYGSQDASDTVATVAVPPEERDSSIDMTEQETVAHVPTSAPLSPTPSPTRPISFPPAVRGGAVAYDSNLIDESGQDGVGADSDIPRYLWIRISGVYDIPVDRTGDLLLKRRYTCYVACAGEQWEDIQGLDNRRTPFCQGYYSGEQHIAVDIERSIIELPIPPSAIAASPASKHGWQKKQRTHTEGNTPAAPDSSMLIPKICMFRVVIVDRQHANADFRLVGYTNPVDAASAQLSTDVSFTLINHSIREIPGKVKLRVQYSSITVASAKEKRREARKLGISKEYPVYSSAPMGPPPRPRRSLTSPGHTTVPGTPPAKVLSSVFLAKMKCGSASPYGPQSLAVRQLSKRPARPPPRPLFILDKRTLSTPLPKRASVPDESPIPATASFERDAETKIATVHAIRPRALPRPIPFRTTQSVGPASLPSLKVRPERPMSHGRQRGPSPRFVPHSGVREKKDDSGTVTEETKGSFPQNSEVSRALTLILQKRQQKEDEFS